MLEPMHRAIVLAFLFLAGSAQLRQTLASDSTGGPAVLLLLGDADRNAPSQAIQPFSIDMNPSGRVENLADSAHFRGGKFSSPRVSSNLTRAFQESNELTIEVWLRASNTTQKGPARILSFSKNSNERNFTLGQDQDRIDIRLRTTKTHSNGLPSLASPKNTVTRVRTHVVYTRDQRGNAKLFVNGELCSQRKVAGTFANWDDSYQLTLGNEVTGARAWNGHLYQVALYTRALSEAEIVANHSAGLPVGKPSQASAEELAAVHFRRSIAPILSKHCLECHDLASAKGDLVLDRQSPSYLESVTPGDAESSPLWLAVESDEMPHNRAPLLPNEKVLLREWIQSGAKWSLDWIDPADYLHAPGTSSGFIRRLTVDEYIQTVRDAVGVDIREEALELLPKELRADGFRNTAYNLTVDLDHIQAYNELANRITAQLDARAFANQFWGKARLTDQDMRGLIEKMGARILRGPLNESEVDLFRGVSTTVAASGGDYEAAVKATVTAMLQSPRFLYLIESQTEDGSAVDLSRHQLASRISHIVWGSLPDPKLLDALSDESFDRETVRRQVLRMLKDPRAISRSHEFLSQWLNLDHVDSLKPDHDQFPTWNANLADDMREETHAFFEHLVWNERRPLVELLDAQVTFCSPELANHYGLGELDPVAINNESGIARYDLSGTPTRGGLLTQGSLLTIGGDDASTVTRGLFVLHQLLRGVVNDPPPCVDTTPVPASPGASTRMIAEARIKNESCGGCHQRFEPLAFGLSKFDGIGAFHERDEFGNRLHDDGRLLVPGASDSIQFENAAQLMKQLASSERVRESLVWKLTQFAIGRPPTSEDADVIRKIHKRSQSAGATYQNILTEIVASELVTP
ncbi:MAG: DUF1592 domain-containing protein [Planctomycetota bacterium]